MFADTVHECDNDGIYNKCSLKGNKSLYKDMNKRRLDLIPI